jgi:chaperonin GroES
MPNYKPLNDHVLIKPLNGDEVSKAGIILPDTVDKEKPEKGEVVATGPGKLLENGQRAPMSVKVGDKVIFKKYSPDELPGDEDLMVIKEEDILAVIGE